MASATPGTQTSASLMFSYFARSANTTRHASGPACHPYPARRGEGGFIRPGFAALVFIVAAAVFFYLDPQAFLPDTAGEPAPPTGAEIPGETAAPDRTPAQDTDWFSAARRYVDRQVETLRDGWTAGGDAAGGAAALLPYEAPETRRILGLDLGVALRTADGVSRWKRLSARHPELRELDPLLVKTRVFQVWPARKLVLVGMSEPVARELCRELATFGTSCTPVRVAPGDIIGKLNTGPLADATPESGEETRTPAPLILPDPEADYEEVRLRTHREASHGRG